MGNLTKEEKEKLLNYLSKNWGTIVTHPLGVYTNITFTIWEEDKDIKTIINKWLNKDAIITIDYVEKNENISERKKEVNDI